jgi:hypothetical protein
MERDYRLPVYRAEGSNADAIWWICRAERLDCFDDRPSRHKCLQRNQGGHPFVCAHMVRELERAQDTGKNNQSWDHTDR